MFMPDARPLDAMLTAATSAQRRAIAQRFEALSDAERQRFWADATELLSDAFCSAYQVGVHKLCKDIVSTVVGKVSAAPRVVACILRSNLSFHETMLRVEAELRDDQCDFRELPLDTVELSGRGRAKVLAYCLTLVAAAVVYTCSTPDCDATPNVCCICADAKCDAPLSCGHMVACRACIQRMIAEIGDDRGGIDCPVCRSRAYAAYERDR